MPDVIFVVVILVFFAVCALYIRACDWIIGPDHEFELDDEGTDDGRRPEPAEVAG